jgi:hypothetical protein
MKAHKVKLISILCRSSSLFSSEMNARTPGRSTPSSQSVSLPRMKPSISPCTLNTALQPKTTLQSKIKYNHNKPIGTITLLLLPRLRHHSRVGLICSQSHLMTDYRVKVRKIVVQPAEQYTHHLLARLVIVVSPKAPPSRSARAARASTANTRIKVIVEQISVAIFQSAPEETSHSLTGVVGGKKISLQIRSSGVLIWEYQVDIRRHTMKRLPGHSLAMEFVVMVHGAIRLSHFGKILIATNSRMVVMRPGDSNVQSVRKKDLEGRTNSKDILSNSTIYMIRRRRYNLSHIYQVAC